LLLILIREIGMPDVSDVEVRKPSSEEEAVCKSWPIWECDESTFDWDYTQTETCLLLEGEVEVTDRPAGENSVKFKQGDLVVFPVGLKCIWKVSKPVKKHYDFS
jgi:hypothetical protein